MQDAWSYTLVEVLQQMWHGESNSHLSPSLMVDGRFGHDDILTSNDSSKKKTRLKTEYFDH